MAKTTIMATRDGGTALVILGKIRIIAMVKATNATIIKSGLPVNHSTCPFIITLNCSSCAEKMITARPFTKPNITGCGTSLINLPSLKTPTPI